MTRDHFKIVTQNIMREFEIKTAPLQNQERPATSMTSPKTRKIIGSSKVLKTCEDTVDTSHKLFPEEQVPTKSKKRSFKIQLYNTENISR